MASRSSSSSSTQNNRQHDHKGFNNKTQKRFVPKTQNSASSSSSSSSSSSALTREPLSTTNQPFTTSLREEPTTTTMETSTNLNTRVRIGENGDWVSSRKQQDGNFVKYLPQDEAVAAGLGVEDGALDPVESQRVVDLLNRELSRLLKLNPRDFWKEVASDTSLHDFLDSFLQFRNRWYDFPYHGAKGIVAGVIIGELELSRRVFMVLYRISSKKDPGALASNSLSVKEHEALLQEKKLLQLPKLLDICAIYGHENEDMTRSLVVNAMKAQPRLHENLAATVSHFLSITHTMHQRCNSSLEALFSSESGVDPGDSRLISDFSEVMDFINDAVASLDAFVSAYKPAAVYFSCLVEMSYGNGELLNTLARLHDSLLPSLQGGFRHVFSAGGDGVLNTFSGTVSSISISSKMLSMRIASLGWKLLDICYLSDEVFEGSFPLPTPTKMFPASVDDPAIRGDILIQTFREINEEASHHVRENMNSRTFLQNLEKYHKILNKLNDLRGNGWVFLDDEQFQYLSLIVTPPPSKAVNKNPVSIVDRVRTDEDAAVTESKISQVKDLFPDYGIGFLAACLEVYNQNPEEVIQRILEGTLHEDLKSLDISLEKIPPPKSASASSLSRKDKGKAALVEPRTSPPANVAVAVQEKRNEGPSGSVGRYTRKSRADSSNSKTLDSLGGKESIKSAVLASLEYEDEYDDSFDDLGLSVAESGYDDTEMGNRISSAPRKYSGGETESTYQSNSLPNRASLKKPQFSVKDSGGQTESTSQSNSLPKWASQKKPQFSVKDSGGETETTSQSNSLPNRASLKKPQFSVKDSGGQTESTSQSNSLPKWASQKKPQFSVKDSGGETETTSQSSSLPKWATQKKPQYYVKDGKNYSYNVSGSTAVANSQEAALLNHVQRDTIHGLGRGGNHPGGSVKAWNELNQQNQEDSEDSDAPETEESGGNPGNARGRGGRRGGAGNRYRKDRAMKKHFAGIGGGF